MNPATRQGTHTLKIIHPWANCGYVAISTKRRSRDVMEVITNCKIRLSNTNETDQGTTWLDAHGSKRIPFTVKQPAHTVLSRVEKVTSTTGLRHHAILIRRKECNHTVWSVRTRVVSSFQQKEESRDVIGVFSDCVYFVTVQGTTWLDVRSNGAKQLSKCQP